MREITIITNLQITQIYKDVPEDFEIDKKMYADGQKEIVKELLDADDVVVTNVHEVELQGLRDQMDDEFVGGNDE